MTNTESRTALAAHTPGPWVAIYSRNGDAAISIEAPNDRAVVGAVGCVIRKNGIGMPCSAVGLANARLIAAAPDMLAALRECADDLASEIEARYSHGIKDHPAMTPKYERDMAPVHRARAAITKATGGTVTKQAPATPATAT